MAVLKFPIGDTMQALVDFLDREPDAGVFLVHNSDFGVFILIFREDKTLLFAKGCEVPHGGTEHDVLRIQEHGFLSAGQPGAVKLDPDWLRHALRSGKRWLRIYVDDYTTLHVVGNGTVQTPELAAYQR